MPNTDTLQSPAHRAAQLRVLCAGICALILTIGLARFAYTPLLPIMREQAGLSFLAGGWLATFNYLGYLAGALLAAAIQDLDLKFKLYRLGLVIAVLSTAAMGWTDNVVWWAVLRLVSGLSSATGLLIGSGLVLNWLMRNGLRAELGLHFTGIGLGIMVSGLAVIVMQGTLDWVWQWNMLGVLGLVLFIPAWGWMPAPAPAATRAGLPSAAMAGSTPSRRWMLLLMGSYFCAGFGYVVSATFIVAIIEKMPMMVGQGVWLWVALGFAAVPSSLMWDRIARRIGYISALIVGFALQTVSILLPVLSQNPLINLLSAVLYGGTFIGLVSLTLTLIGRRFPGNPASAMAKLTLSYGVAQIVAPAMAGYIAAATGGYGGALIIAVLVMVVGMLLLLVLNALEHRSHEPKEIHP